MEFLDNKVEKPTSSEKFKQFAYSVMHDLKSPAVGIHGLTELLHKQYGDSLNEKGRKYCEQILKASVHLAALIEMINSYIAAKESELRLDKIEVKEVLRTLREQFFSLVGCASNQVDGP